MFTLEDLQSIVQSGQVSGLDPLGRSRDAPAQQQTMAILQSLRLAEPGNGRLELTARGWNLLRQMEQDDKDTGGCGPYIMNRRP